MLPRHGLACSSLSTNIFLYQNLKKKIPYGLTPHTLKTKLYIIEIENTACSLVYLSFSNIVCRLGDKYSNFLGKSKSLELDYYFKSDRCILLVFKNTYSVEGFQVKSSGLNFKSCSHFLQPQQRHFGDT